MAEARQIPDFAVGQTWYLWMGVVWQRYEIRALVDEEWIVWRTPRSTQRGEDYTAIARVSLETYRQLGQLQPTPPLRPWQHYPRPEERA